LQGIAKGKEMVRLSDVGRRLSSVPAQATTAYSDHSDMHQWL